MNPPAPQAREDGPEIVIGLVGAVGTDLGLVTTTLEAAVHDVAYRTEVIRLSALLRELTWDRDLPEKPLDDHIEKHMDAGDDLREAWGRGDALALISLSAIADIRERLNPGDPEDAVPRCAYILRSLKHPEEVERLRAVYGKRFVLIAAYTPRDQRADALAREIAADRHSMRPQDFLHRAHQLIQRDEAEEERRLGQNVRDTFHRADLFVDARDRHELEAALERMVEILFGHPFQTPTRDEHAMFLAEAAAMRSAEMGRQVGAVVTTPEGDVVSVGCNDVPKAGGGLYWNDDELDGRDFRRGEDTSEEVKRRITGELLDRLSERGWLQRRRATASAEELYRAVEGTRLANLIEFGRAVHAEMAAITNAARRGVAVGECSLYTTTFPCHECARHMVAAGINRIVYIAPYSKSLAHTLHDDAISLDHDCPRPEFVQLEPFVGVAPRSYLDLFSMPRRKEPDGKAVEFVKNRAVPRLVESEPEELVAAYRGNELLAFQHLQEVISESDIQLSQ